MNIYDVVRTARLGNDENYHFVCIAWNKAAVKRADNVIFPKDVPYTTKCIGHAQKGTGARETIVVCTAYT